MRKTALVHELREKLSAATTDAKKVSILAQSTDLSPNQAVILVEHFGPDTKKLVDEAVLFKAEG